MRFVGYDVWRLIMLVGYDVCCLITFVANDVCRIMAFVALWRLSPIMTFFAYWVCRNILYFYCTLVKYVFLHRSTIVQYITVTIVNNNKHYLNNNANLKAAKLYRAFLHNYKNILQEGHHTCYPTAQQCTSKEKLFVLFLKVQIILLMQFRKFFTFFQGSHFRVAWHLLSGQPAGKTTCHLPSRVGQPDTCPVGWVD